MRARAGKLYFAGAADLCSGPEGPPEATGAMEGVRKLARSQSIKICEKLRIPVGRVERSESREREVRDEEGDSATPTQLPILRSFHSVTKEMSDKKETIGGWAN